jgi:uncharacterized repeat protein (TIGR03803 family)
MLVQTRTQASRAPGAFARGSGGWPMLAACLLLWMACLGVCAADPVSVLHDLTSAEGWPASVLVEASDGSFYGTTEYGGPGGSNSGTVFRVTPDGVFATLHVFAGSDGSAPTALTLAADGNLYGTTLYGGSSNAGTVFRVSIAGVFTSVYSFAANAHNAGVAPSQLALGNDGLLYGMTTDGGDNASGSVFKITTDGVLTTIYSFPVSSLTGGDSGPLLLGHDGNFYGVSLSGGGALFRITPAGVFTLIHAFTEAESYGTNPLVQDADGNLYGTTGFGGTNHTGIVFKVAASGTLTTLHTFTTLDEEPGPLVDGHDGSFYGLTTMGGDTTCGCGTLYRVTPAGSFTAAYYFGATLQSVYMPHGGMMLGSDGLLYGSAVDGATGSRTIFRFDKTAAPPPDISLSLNPAEIISGGSSHLDWSAINADACTASDAWSGAQAMSGSMDVSPTATGTYTLTCTGPGGTAIVSRTLVVYPPPTVSFTVTPASITLGDSATLQWDSEHSQTCVGSGAWSGEQGTIGVLSVMPAAPGNYTYTITCQAQVGDSTAVATVTLAVNAPGGGGFLGLEDLALGLLVASRVLLRRRALRALPPAPRT